MTPLDDPGQELYDRMAAAYVLDPVAEAILLAACRELDTSETARAGIDPTTADGRRRLSLARQARSAFVAHLKSFRQIAEPQKPAPRKLPTATPASDPRGALA